MPRKPTIARKLRPNLIVLGLPAVWSSSPGGVSVAAVPAKLRTPTTGCQVIPKPQVLSLRKSQKASAKHWASSNLDLQNLGTPQSVPAPNPEFLSRLVLLDELEVQESDQLMTEKVESAAVKMNSPGRNQSTPKVSQSFPDLQSYRFPDSMENVGSPNALIISEQRTLGMLGQNSDPISEDNRLTMENPHLARASESAELPNGIDMQNLVDAGVSADELHYPQQNVPWKSNSAHTVDANAMPHSQCLISKACGAELM